MALQVGIVRGLTGHFPGFAREGIDLWLHWCHNRVMGVYVKPGPDETSSVRAVSPLFPGLLCFALHALLVLAGLSALHPWSQVTSLYEVILGQVFQFMKEYKGAAGSNFILETLELFK